MLSMRAHDDNSPRRRPATSLGDRVDRARAQGFVGRNAELELFKALLRPEPPQRGLIVHGPGGVGKTSLIEAFQQHARESGVATARIDGRDLPGDPGAVEHAVWQAVSGIETGSDRPALLLLDSFESLAPMERWFREEIMAALPDHFRVVLAMRRRPESAWQVDPGWACLTRIAELGGLNRDESARLLRARGVPESRFDELCGLTEGHPLALTLAANLVVNDPSAPLNLTDSPELVRELVKRHTADAPDRECRLALYACALARDLNEPLLAAMIDSPAAAGAFEWLRRQSFVHERSRGLQAHELVGEALSTELQQRDPECYRRTVHNGMRFLFDRARSHGGQEAIEDVLYLMRDLPAIRETFVVSRDSGFTVDRVRDTDARPLARLVEQPWGGQSRRWFETWLGQAPEWLAVLRDAERRPIGMSFYLDVTTVDDELARADPAVFAFRDHLARRAPLRTGERAMLSRFLLAGDGDLGAGLAQLQCRNALMPLKVPDLAFTGSVRRDTAENRLQARYSGIAPLAGSQFRCDGRDYFIMGHDWRVEPPVDWLEGLAERLVNQAVPIDSPAQAEVMDEAEFAGAVKQTLRALAAGDDLDDQRLAHSVMVRRAIDQRSDGASPAEVLRDLIERAVQSSADQPRGDELRAVIHHTYLEPAAKQRAAADETGLSYGTYRRRLREAVARVGEYLWRLEIAAGRAEGGR